jgi:guanylate kinase
MSKGRLFVISGASGVGKSTVLNKVMAERSDLRFSVSATTRAPRPGETNGINYYFVSKEKFQEMIAQDAFLEYDAHMDNYYGTPKRQVEEKLKKASNEMVVSAIVKCVAEIVLLKEQIAKLEKRIEALEGKA